MHNSKRTAAIAIALSAIFLSAGCAGAPVVHYNQIYHDGWRSFFAQSAVTDEIKTRINGTPVGASVAFRNSLILREFQGAFNNKGFRFVVEPAVEARGRPYLSVIFTGSDYPRSDACLPYTTTNPPPAGTIYMRASLCRGSAPLTTASGSVSGVTGPDDPRVRYLVRQVANKTFESPHRSNRDLAADF